MLASWCNGSTRDSESLCLGSNPSEAARSVRAPCMSALREQFFESSPVVRRYYALKISDSNRIISAITNKTSSVLAMF